jgi:O-antigen/teichoic acid export membrane protein
LVVFAKLLQPGEFGLYSIALSIIETAGVVTNMFFFEALIQHSRAEDRHFDSAFTASIAMSLCVFGLLWFVFPVISSSLNHSNLAVIGRALATTLLLSGPMSIFQARLVREFDFRVLALRTVLGRIVGALMGIAAALCGLGVWALVLQYMSMTLLGSLTLFIFSPWRPRITFHWRPLGELISYGIGSVITLAAAFATQRVFVFSVGTFLGVDQAGVLSLAFRLVDTVFSISAGAISQVLLPLMARLQNDRERLLDAYRSTLGLGCALIYPMFSGIGATAPELIELLFGKKWAAAAQPTLWLSFLVFVQAPQIFQISLLKMNGDITSVRNIRLAMLAFTLTGVAFVINFPTVTSALSLWSAGNAFHFLLLAMCIQLSLKVSTLEQLRLPLVPFVGSMIMAANIQFMRHLLQPDSSSTLLSLIVLCSIGALSYAVVILTFGRSLVRRALWIGASPTRDY